jgi:hypothetical protein
MTYHIGIVFLICPVVSFAVVTANYSDAENFRFENDPAFIGNPYDWSGVGRTSDGTTNREWATLLGENYFISAVHYHPTTGETITFKDGNSLLSTTYNYTVSGGFAVSGTDLWIGYTNAPIDSSLKRYSITNTPADTLAEVGLGGSTLYVTGDNVSGGPGEVTDHVVGTNQAESWLESGTDTFTIPESTLTFTPNASFDQLITFENLSGDTSNTFTTHEAQIQSGDSGAPLFSFSGGDLEIVGIGYAVLTNVSANFIDTNGPAGGNKDPLEARNVSFYNYPGSYESEIATAIALVPDSLVPEPSSATLLLFSIFLIKRRR